MAPGLQVLGEAGTLTVLATLESGADLEGGGTAPGRRVQVAWGDDFSTLNSDGQTLMRRSIEWAATAPTSAGPIAHWKLDDTAGTAALDSAGTHIGILINSPAWTVGQVDGALDFDGNNDFINVPHNDALALTETLTFMAWINPASIGANYNTVLAKDSGVGTSSNFWFGLYQDEVDFGFFSGGAFREVFTAGLNVQAGNWQHIAVSFSNATDEVLLYLGGVLVHTGSLAFTPVADTTDITIGRSPIGEYWNGLLDDVRIYDRVLGAAEITDIFTVGSSGGGSDPISCNGTYRDDFNDTVMNGSTGSINWSSTPWVEVGETDGMTSGDIRIREDDNNDGHLYRLRIRDNNNDGEGMQREANLNGATTATLSFDYRRMNLDNSNDYVALYASSTGTAGPWTELDRFASTNDSAYQPFSVDISDYISATTAIRLRSSTSMGNTDTVWFDNIQIECIP